MKLLPKLARRCLGDRLPLAGRVALAVFAIGFATLGTAPVAEAASGLESLEKQVKEFTLDNGLKFIVVERHDAPVFSFQTLVNAGSAYDGLGTTGIAHMMEHMAFKGTEIVGTNDAEGEREAMADLEKAWDALLAERRKGHRADTAKLEQLEKGFGEAQERGRSFVVSNAFSRLVEEAGAQGLNAFTADDYAGYLYSLPSNRLELWALLEGSRMTFPVFREFYKERDVVYEERRMRYESSPFGRLFLEFIQTAFVAHPYGTGGIGHPSDLRTFSRTEGKEFYDTYYVAPNMVVAVVGDVSAKKVKKLAEKYWSDLPAGPMPPPIDTVEPEQNAERRTLIEDASQPLILVGWHCPAVSDPTYPAYEALASLVGGGDFARLPKALVKDKKIAVQVQAIVGLPGNRYPSLFGVIVVPAPGEDPLEVEQEIYRVFEEVQTTNPLTQEELDGYKVRTRASMIRSAQSNMSLAGALAQNQILMGDWHEFFRTQEQVESLTLQDLSDAMARTLKKSNRTVGMIVNPEKKEESTEGSQP